MSEPEWLRVGADVARYWPGNRQGRSVSYTTVERLTKTQVVLEDGTRFRRDKLWRSLGTWGGTEELRPADDPQVTATARTEQAARIRSRAAMDAEGALRQWRETGDSVAAQNVIDTLTRALDRIRLLGPMP